jgi:hypothetical protein
MHRPRAHLGAGLAVLALVGSAALAGCSEGTVDLRNAGSGESPVTEGPSGDDSGDGETSYAVDPPGPRETRLSADLLITGKDTLPESLVERIRSLRVQGKKGVQAALPISVASAPVDGRTLTVAAVDPGEFRRFAPIESWEADFVWERLAGGEVAVDPGIPKRVISKGDMIRLGNDEELPAVHIGAYAPLVQQVTGAADMKPAIQAIVNEKRGEQLGMVEDNALLVSTGSFTPSALIKPLKKMLGDRGTAQILALELGLGPQLALLTGTSVSDAVGTFSYTSNADGTINPDPAWVKEFIRTEEVPILGTVTCNKGMLPQFRAALDEIVKAGLADKIHPDEYAGCYYPRYIASDPSNGLSLHSWGIAVDLNVPGNLRGTVGEIDRGVVAIFKKWGFAWGGDWNYTDPMHFEMNAVVRPS